ncbi:MAG TPA: hypothetical protein VFR58_11040 [Flavisolibacter sp.]|nr:hypothetical protein [Flavisolibacter sp.]
MRGNEIPPLDAMTVQNFMSMSEEEKAEALLKGRLAGVREDEWHTILLYKMDSFYVEVYYRNGLRQPSSFRPSTSKDLLELYYNAYLN